MAEGRVQRLLRLITLMQSGEGRQARDLMAELRVSRRTLFRDLRMLEAAGVPYYYSPRLGYRIRQTFFLPPVSFTVPETLGLLLLGKLARAQRDQPLMAAAVTALTKLGATVPAEILTVCSDLVARVSVRPAAPVPGDRQAELFTRLQRCIDEGRTCRLLYKSPDEREEQVLPLDPYALHWSERAWYVLGRSHLHREVRVLKLARVRSIETLTRRFERPKRFTPAEKFGDAWRMIPEGRRYHVELEFSAKVATNVTEVRWHASQRAQPLEDGRCRMSFTIDGLREIAWWIVGYGGEVRVVSPAALRERVRQLHETAVRLNAE